MRIFGDSPCTCYRNFTVWLALTRSDCCTHPYISYHSRMQLHQYLQPCCYCYNGRIASNHLLACVKNYSSRHCDVSIKHLFKLTNINIVFEQWGSAELIFSQQPNDECPPRELCSRTLVVCLDLNG